MKKQLNKLNNNKNNLFELFSTFMLYWVAKLNLALPFLLFTEKLQLIKKNPYLRLMRLDKLTGFWLVLIPALIAIALGAQNLVRPIYTITILVIGALCFRGAGCVINDILDHKFDSEVKRTKTRPLASGELNKMQAILLFAILCTISLAALLALPITSIKLGVLTLFLVVIYPMAKRYLRAPQFFLGMVINLGVFIAWFGVNNNFSLVPLFIYFASLFWTIGYDTIYAIQDKEYDKKLGLHSTALLFNESNASFVWKVYKFYLSLYLVLGFYMHLNILFFVLLIVAYYHAYWQVKTLDENDPKNCLLCFKSNVVQGFILLLAVLVGLAFKFNI